MRGWRRKGRSGFFDMVEEFCFRVDVKGERGHTNWRVFSRPVVRNAVVTCSELVTDGSVSK